MGEIAFEGFPFTLPTTESEVAERLLNLPEAFYPQLAFGLGIRRHLRPVIEVIARNRFRCLLISRTRPTTVDRPTLVVASRDFDEIAFELGRIATRFAGQSRTERTRHVQNELLAGHFPDELQRNERPLRGGMLVSFLRAAKVTEASLSSADREAVITRAAEEAPRLARRNPRQLYKLQRDFELAGLIELIARFETDLTAPHPESFSAKSAQAQSIYSVDVVWLSYRARPRSSSRRWPNSRWLWRYHRRFPLLRTNRQAVWRSLKSKHLALSC